MLPTFDAENLLNELMAVGVKGQRLFGAFCCERLFPNYLAFQAESNWGNPRVLRDAIDLVWSDLDGQIISIEKVQQLVGECEIIAPSSSDFNSIRVTSAQDTCFAICSLLDHLLDARAEMIVTVATYSIDSIDLFVQEIENMPSNHPDLEKMILTHPLMQRELTRQKDDLEIIRQALSSESSSVTSFGSLRRSNEKGSLNML